MPGVMQNDTPPMPWTTTFSVLLANIGFACAGLDAADDLLEGLIVEPHLNQVQFAKDTTFDEWVFNNNSDRFQTEIDGLFNRRVEEILKRFRLAESHREKLKLAARGDVNRYLDDLEDVRRRFDATLKEDNGIEEHPATSEWAMVRKEATRFRTRHKKLFDQNSLVWKVATRIAAEEDLKRRRLSISLVVREIASSVDLDSEQEQALVTLVQGELSTTRVHKDFDTVLVGYNCSQIPAQTLKSVFHDDQLPQVLQVLASYQQHRDLLTRHRLIPVEQGAATASIRISRYQRRNGPASALFPDNLFAPEVGLKQDKR